MKTSREGIALLHHYEDCRLVSYPDPKTGSDPWTIGWGATGPGIGPGLIWSQQQADDRFERDVAEREEIVRGAVRVDLQQGMFDAMVSIVFNVGAGASTKDGIVRLKNGKPSTLLRLLNSGDYWGAREQFARWISPGSNVELGLKRRRRAEQGLWDGLTARDAIAVSEVEFPLRRRGDFSTH